MSDKRHQLSILDQWASSSGQVSRSTQRLSEIDGFIQWGPLYEIGRRIDKTGARGGQPRKPVRWMIRGLFLGHPYQLSWPPTLRLRSTPTPMQPRKMALGILATRAISGWMWAANLF